MNYRILIIALSFVFAGCNNKEGVFVPAADFEENETIFIGWDNYIPQKTLAFIVGVSQDEGVTLIVANDKRIVNKAKNLLKENGANLSNIEFLKTESSEPELWVRDYFPVFMYDEYGNERIQSTLYNRDIRPVSKEIAKKRRIKIKIYNLLDY